MSFLLINTLASYNLYYANLHSHTRYSDGRGTPAHAFAYARDTARIHILAITDHGEMLDSLEWADTQWQAQQATIPGVFLGLVGFEWTSWTQGHINIFNTPNYTNRDSTPTIDSLYHWLQTQPNAIGQFNHPWPTAFNSFSYNPAADSFMLLYEMQTAEQANWYHIALDSGWRVTIAANQDNHFADWGMGKQLTGIWADTLTKSSIIQAIKAHRTFGTLDRNFQLWFKANGHWMGSTIADDEISFEIWAFDPDTQDFIKRIDIITNGNTIVDSIILGNTNYFIFQTKRLVNNQSSSYFFVRVIENDSDYIISSPIWIRRLAIDPDLTKMPGVGSLLIYPNPFTTNINFLFLPDSLSVLKIYSATGQKVRTLSLAIQDKTCLARRAKDFSPGLKHITWDGNDDLGNPVPTGLYFVSFERENKFIRGKCQKIIRLPNSSNLRSTSGGSLFKSKDKIMLKERWQ